MICVDPFFCKCYWTIKEINILLDPIKVYIKVISSVYNCYKKALTLINHK